VYIPLSRRRHANAHQRRRLGAEALHLGVVLWTFVHPAGGLLEPGAGLVLFDELPVGNGREEAVVRVRPVILTGQNRTVNQ
jgi:hypothetical protein